MIMTSLVKGMAEEATAKAGVTEAEVTVAAMTTERTRFRKIVLLAHKRTGTKCNWVILQSFCAHGLACKLVRLWGTAPPI